LFEDIICIVVGVVVDPILLVTNQHVDMHVGCNKYFVFTFTCEAKLDLIEYIDAKFENEMECEIFWDLYDTFHLTI